MNENTSETVTITVEGFILGSTFTALCVFLVALLWLIPENRAVGRCYPNKLVGFSGDFAICATPEGGQELKRFRGE